VSRIYYSEISRARPRYHFRGGRRRTPPISYEAPDVHPSPSPTCPAGGARDPEVRFYIL